MADDVRGFRREQIVSEARRLVADRGLEGLTIGSLEKRLPFTRGVITYHFDNKDDIVTAVLDSAVAEIDEATYARVRESADDDKVRAVLRGMVGGFLEHRESTRILLAYWSRVHVDAQASQVNADLYARYRRSTRRLLDDLETHGDRDAQAALVVGTVIGIVTQIVFDPDFADVDVLVDEAARSFTYSWSSPR